MDQNKLVSFMKGLNSSPQTVAKLEKILRGSAESLQLLKGVQEAPAEKKEKAQEAFLAQQREIVGEYETLLSDMGMTKETLESYASDPKNFTPESWEFLESFKKEVAANAPKPNERCEPKKVKKAPRRTKKEWLSA